jgi:hypothetical protein
VIEKVLSLSVPTDPSGIYDSCGNKLDISSRSFEVLVVRNLRLEESIRFQSILPTEDWYFRGKTYKEVNDYIIHEIKEWNLNL